MTATERQPWDDPDPWTGTPWTGHRAPDTNGAHDDIPFGDTAWEPTNLAQLPQHPPVQPTLGDLGIVYPGKRHVFSGPQESAKTLAAYLIAIAVIRTGQRVLIIDFEMGAYDARNRLTDLGCTHQELDSVIYIEPSEHATPERVHLLIQLEPALVIVDAAAGAYDLQGLDDNKRSDVEKFTRMYVQPFWRDGIASIVLDHVVKSAEGRGSYAIGSERKVGGADVHLGFQTITPIKRGSNGLYKITTHKDRGGYLKRGKLGELELSSDPDTHQITWKITVETESDDPWRPTHLMEKISRHLESLDESVSRNQIEAVLGGKRATLLQAVSFLIKDGYATETNQGVALTRVYRAPEDPTGTQVPGGSQTVPGTTGSLVPPLTGGASTGTPDGTTERFPIPEDGIPF